jgi:hemolysin activation/secretion protein
LFASHAQTGFAWGGSAKVLQLASDLSGRLASGFENTRLDLSGEYFQRAGDKHVWYARLGGSLAANLDPDNQLLLGGDNGLRGYPLRYQAGTASALLTLEHRYFTDWYPLRLVRVGAAVFFDAGRTWGSDVVGTPNLGLLKDVGVGLRLGNQRSSHGSVIHLDVAFPLDRTDDIDSVQFLIQTRKTF